MQGAKATLLRYHDVSAIQVFVRLPCWYYWQKWINKYSAEYLTAWCLHESTRT